MIFFPWPNEKRNPDLEPFCPKSWLPDRNGGLRVGKMGLVDQTCSGEGDRDLSRIVSGG